MLIKIIEQIKGHDMLKARLRPILKKGRLNSALLFSGPSGVGKKMMAYAVAQILLCEGEDPPCGACSHCKRVFNRQSEHVWAVTHKTLQIRLQDVQPIPPFLALQSFARAKVVVLDSAEKLNRQAGNFLLKIVEEPPPKSYFFFISSSPSKLPLTLKSRLQNLRFQALPEEVIREISGDLPQWMIRSAKGRLDLLEELKEVGTARKLALVLWSDILKSSFSTLAGDFSKRISNRKEALTVVRFWQEILRDARLLKWACEDQLIHGPEVEEVQKLSRFPNTVLDLWIQKVLEMERDLQAGADPSLCFENSVITMRKSLGLSIG